jgi:CRISPR-associated endonuclease/helicase Cas3
LTRRDYFVGNLDQIMHNTTPELLQKSLFRRWCNDDAMEGQSLHIEPTEDRRHAYQWNKPSGDPNRRSSGTMLGANRLAIEALPLFPGLPSANPERLRTAGWTGVRSTDSRWTWPVWSVPLSLPVVASLITLPELQDDSVDIANLRSKGIAAAYRSRRILVEKTPNLTPSIVVA